jgi:hypothetical protein
LPRYPKEGGRHQRSIGAVCFNGGGQRRRMAGVFGGARERDDGWICVAADPGSLHRLDPALRRLPPAASPRARGQNTCGRFSSAPLRRPRLGLVLTRDEVRRVLSSCALPRLVVACLRVRRGLQRLDDRARHAYPARARRAREGAPGSVRFHFDRARLVVPVAVVRVRDRRQVAH